jgi:hypothetical protein
VEAIFMHNETIERGILTDADPCPVIPVARLMTIIVSQREKALLIQWPAILVQGSLTESISLRVNGLQYRLSVGVVVRPGRRVAYDRDAADAAVGVGELCISVDPEYTTAEADGTA